MDSSARADSGMIADGSARSDMPGFFASGADAASRYCHVQSARA
jgi:hypothetical protein